MDTDMENKLPCVASSGYKPILHTIINVCSTVTALITYKIHVTCNLYFVVLIGLCGLGSPCRHSGLILSLGLGS